MKFLTPTTPILITTICFGSVAFAAPPEDDLLAGPTIVEEEVTEQDMLSRKLQETGKSFNVGSRQQAKIWRNALVSLDLTQDQSMAMNDLKREFEEAQRAFQKEHGKELRTIREEQNAAKKEGNTPSSDSRTRMMELIEMAPNVSKFQEKAWVLLTTDQQSAFQLKYQELIVEEEKRKEEQKKVDRPMKDELQDGGFAPKDSKFKDPDSNPEGDTIERHRDSVDQSSLRRIKFLRRLQQLEKDD